MILEDEYDGSDRLRRALSVAASSAPHTVDPSAARRAGDARKRTRTAVTTSLAFSLVIFAGLGSVYFAAHRSRPASLGSDNAQATPAVTVSPSPSTAALTVSFYTDPVTPTAGHSVQLFVSGAAPSPVQRIDVRWGDGMTDGVVGDPDAASPSSATVYQEFVHTYSQPGTVYPRVTVTSSGQPEVASFPLTVLPAPTPPAALVVTSPSVSATPTLKPTHAARRTATPNPTATLIRIATPTASRSVTSSPSVDQTHVP